MNKKEELLKEWNGGIARGAQRKLAGELNLNEASVSSWLSGRATPSESNLLKMSKIFNKGLAELQDIFIGERKNTGGLGNDGSYLGAAANIAVYGAISKNKDKFVLSETPEVYLPIKKSSSEKLFAIKMHGDSMADPKTPQNSIFEGDYLIINPDISTLKDGMIVLAKADGQSTIKRYYKTDNIIELVPDNPKYKTLKLDLYKVELCGYVAHIHRPAQPRPRAK